MTDEKVEKRLQEIRDTAAQYAKAKSERVRLEEFRKTKKALLMREAEKAGAKSAAQQEREAYADDAYLEVINGLAAATEQEEHLRWYLKSCEWHLEAWRTQQANQRAERQRYGA
jgi:hypothetical protein